MLATRELPLNQALPGEWKSSPRTALLTCAPKPNQVPQEQDSNPGRRRYLPPWPSGTYAAPFRRDQPGLLRGTLDPIELSPDCDRSGSLPPFRIKASEPKAPGRPPTHGLRLLEHEGRKEAFFD